MYGGIPINVNVIAEMSEITFYFELILRKSFVPIFSIFIWISKGSAYNSAPIFRKKENSIRCDLMIGAVAYTHALQPLYSQHDYMWLNVSNISWQIMFNRCFMFVYVFLKTHEHELIPITVFTNLFDRIIGNSLLSNQWRLQIRKSDLVFSLTHYTCMITIEYWVD